MDIALYKNKVDAEQKLSPPPVHRWTRVHVSRVKVQEHDSWL